MTCAEFQEHLDPFFDNELGLAEAQKIQQHIEQCSACEAIYAARLAVREALQKPEVRFTPPVDLQDQIQAELSKQVRPAPRRQLAPADIPILQLASTVPGRCRGGSPACGSASPSFPLQTDRPTAF